MNLQNKTVINKAVYTDFQLFRRKYIKSSSVLNTLIYLLAALIAAAVIAVGVLLDMLLVLLVGILIALFYLRIIFEKWINPRKMFEKNKLKETAVNYVFTKNSFRIPKNDDSAEAPYIKYSQLSKVYETKEMYYLFVEKNICYLVAKNGFCSDDNSVFSAHLKNVMGKKYVRCK